MSCRPHLRKSSKAFSRNVIAVTNHLKDNKRSSGVGSVSPLTAINVWILPGMFLKHLLQIENASWYCNHCAHAVPGVQKLLIRVGNVEEKCEALNKRVESLENKSFVSPDTVKDLVNEEVAELKEIESRKLNLICLNLPESKRTDAGERQQEDLEFLNNLLENKMNLEPDTRVIQ